MIHEYFPEEFIQLNKELNTPYHPKLSAIVANETDMEVKLAQIAAYCEVMLDDIYTFEDRVKLAGILYEKLVAKRERPSGILIIS